MRRLPQHGELVSVRRLFRSGTGGLLALLPALASAAGPDAIDNILVTRTGDRASIQVLTSCRVRYESHAPGGTGIELRITVRPAEDCGLMPNPVGRTYRPAGRELGRIEDVSIDFAEDGSWFLTLRFSEAVNFDVRPHAAGWLDIEVETGPNGTPPVAQRPPPLPSAGTTTDRPRTDTTRPAAGRAARVTGRFGSSAPNDETFVVQLGVFADARKARAALAAAEIPGFAYTTSFELNDTTWHALQVGFFDTEHAAERSLDELVAVFPDAWVRLVDPAERRTAEQNGALVARPGGAVAIAPRADATADEAALKALLRDASQAIIDRRYDEAVSAYSRVLEVPSHPFRAEAREYIGIALERSGETARAVAEYEAWLDEFPDQDGADRVALRLRGLSDAGITPEALAVPPAAPAAAGWEWYGGVSQYYWRNEEQMVNEGNHIVSSSGILNLADVTVSRSGRRFDLQARLNGAYQVDLIDYDDQDNLAWVTNAYLDVTDRDFDVRGRVGRQSRRQDGVLGRFDGLSADYELAPGIGLGASAGMPVDSPRYLPGSHRSFLAASARFDDLWNALALNVYAQRQLVDGISDREALGAEARYRFRDVLLLGTLDYDLSFGALNLALLNAQWRLPAGWTVNVRAETGLTPFVTTRNALAGQGASSVDQLLGSYTEGQVRTLARDRTGSSDRLAVSVAIPLSDRFDLGLDAATGRFGGTEASGTVAAIPASGAQTYLAATLVATSLFASDDLHTLGVRFDSSYTRDRLTLLADSRVRLGDRLRLRPSVRISQLDYREPDGREFVIEPSLRLMYRWNRVLFDAETGIRYAERENLALGWDPYSTDGVEQLSGFYLNLGYQMEF